MTKDKSHIYLDYSASTPVSPEVMETMQPYFTDDFGNPGSVHLFGQKAQGALDEARTKIADELGCKFKEIVFTGSATEANDLIIDGVFEGSGIDRPKIVISGIEHESVSETAKNLRDRGAEIVILPTSKEGFVDVENVEKALDERVALVSIIHGSNEIGTIQPIGEIGATIRAFRAESGNRYPVFHSDAVQTIQFMKLNVAELGLDALTLSSQKIYGPKGAGVLYISGDFISSLRPQLVGGSHEFGLRASTPNMPAIVGFGKAVELVSKNRGEESKKITKLRDMLLSGLKELDPKMEVNGSLEGRLPNNLNVYLPGKEDEELVAKLDMAGVAVSSGSACSVRATKVAKAVLALGHGEKRAKGSIRMTLGAPTTEKEIKTALERIERALYN